MPPGFHLAQEMDPFDHVQNPKLHPEKYTGKPLTEETHFKSNSNFTSVPTSMKESAISSIPCRKKCSHMLPLM